MHKLKIVEIVLILLFFSLLTVIITYPAVLYLKTSIIGDAGDNFQFMGFQYVGKLLFSQGNFPFGWVNYWRYPNGINFQNASESGLFILIGLFLYPLISNPLLVYNLSVLFLIILNLLLTYVAFRIVFKSAVSLIGAIMYGLSFYTLARIGGHPNLILHAGFPLFFFSLFLIHKEKGSLKSFLLFTLAILTLTLSSLQYPLLLLGSLVFILPLTILFYPQKVKEFLIIINKRKKYTVASLAIFFLIVLFLYGTKISLFLSGGVKLPDYKLFSVPAINFLIPNSYIISLSNVVLNHSQSWIEYVVFLGFIEIILFISALLLFKRMPGKKFFLLSFLILLIISLGKQTFLTYFWPYQYLLGIFPFRGIIEPGRFFVILNFFLTLIAVIYISKVKNQLILLLILFLLLVERTPININITEIPKQESFFNSVKHSDSQAVLDLPLFTEWWNGHWYDLYSIYYQKPIVNGYFHWSGDKYDPKSFVEELKEYRCDPFPPKSYDEELAHFRKDRTFRLLNYYNIRTIVYHKNLAVFKECGYVDQYLQVFLNEPDRFITLYEDADNKVLWLKKE